MKRLSILLLIAVAVFILPQPLFAQRSLKFQQFVPNNSLIPSVLPNPTTSQSNPSPADPSECARVGGTFIGGICRLDDEIKINANLPPPTGRIYLNSHKIHQIQVSAPDSWGDAAVNVSIQCPVATGFNYSSTLQQKGNGQSLGLIPLLFKNAQGQSDNCTLSLKNSVTGQDYTIQISVVDPFGVVYDSQTNVSIADALVTLIQITPKGEMLWPAQNFNNQKNPQTTKSDGTFSFLVPAGKYYLKAEKPDYQPFQGKEFTVKEEAVEYNIPLDPVGYSKSAKNSLSMKSTSGMIIVLISLFIAIILSILWFKQNKSPKNKKKRR